MQPTALLLSDANGIFIPQMFCQGYALDKWGLDPDGWAVQTCLLGPYEPDYWEAWDQILNQAEFDNMGFKFSLMQDGGLWAVCPALMTDEERMNFGFEERSMNERQLRREAAQLARQCRGIKKSDSWTIREWNDSLRNTVRNFMSNMRRFHRIHGTWEEAA